MKIILKKFLSENMIERIVKFKNRNSRSVYRYLSYSKMTRKLYYAFDSSFRLEQRVVASGINSFFHTDEGLYYAVRIDIHRIEKGLVMKPIRNTFAKNYIEACVESFLKLYKDNKMPVKDTYWCYDVLEEYFNTVDTEDCKIKRAKLVFKNSDFSSINTGIREKESPFFRKKPDNLITIDQLQQLAGYRHSIRAFEDKIVPKCVIDRALNVASLSPSACNREPYVFKIFDKKNKVIFDEIISLPPGAASFKDNIPGLIAVVGKYNTFSHEGDRYNPITDASLATMGLIYGLEAQGVGSCVLHWPEDIRREKRAKELLQLKDEEKIIMFVAFGYPDFETKVTKSTRKDLNSIRTYY